MPFTDKITYFSPQVRMVLRGKVYIKVYHEYSLEGGPGPGTRNQSPKQSFTPEGGDASSDTVPVTASRVFFRSFSLINLMDFFL